MRQIGHSACISRAFIFAMLVAAWPGSLRADVITTNDAKKHVGEPATVCGTIASGKYAESARGSPTFLDFDKASPNATFTVLIWGENRSPFGKPEIALLGKRVCVTGTIQLYQGKPQITVQNPSQMTQQ